VTTRTRKPTTTEVPVETTESKPTKPARRPAAQATGPADLRKPVKLKTQDVPAQPQLKAAKAPATEPKVVASPAKASSKRPVAKEAPTLEADDRCRGKWSACKGKNEAISASWHLCKQCTAKRTTALEAAAKA